MYAEQWCRKTLNKQPKGMLFKSTWEEISLFLEIDRGHTQTTNGIQGDKCRFKNFQEWYKGKEWTTDNFRLFLDSLKKRGLGQESINKHISFAHNIDKYLKTDETLSIKSKAVRAKRIKDVLSYQQIKEISYFKRPYKKYKKYLQARSNALYLFLGSTGCRIGEALNLTWENVEASPVKHVFFPETKNGDEREVPISDEVWDLINQVPKRNRYVFTSVKGTGIAKDGTNALKAQEVNADLKKRAKLLKIKFNVHCHLFRHSWTTEMKLRNVADSDICSIAGWRDSRMLKRYDSSGLSRLMSVSQVHPLMQNSMTELDKIQRIVESARLFYNPEGYSINHVVVDGKAVIEINKL